MYPLCVIKCANDFIEPKTIHLLPFFFTPGKIITMAVEGLMF